MQSNNSHTNEPTDILSDDEDENEARLSCSLRWLINKAYPHGTICDYLPNEHFFQNENNERFLSPDIAIVLLSGDLYIRTFQYITNQKERLITYEDLITYFDSKHISFDMDLLKQDDPLNAHVHLELIDSLMKFYFQLVLNQNLLYQRFDKLHSNAVLTLLDQSTQLNLESLLIIWINGICEYMAHQWSKRIPPVIDLRSAVIDGTCLYALVSYYDEEYAQKKGKHDLNSLRNYLNHYKGSKMTNIFPFTVKNLRENILPDINLQAMLVDLFVLYEISENPEEEKKNGTMHFQENEDDENMCTLKSNQTYSIDGDENDGDDDDDDINEFFILSNNNHNEQPTTGGILQTSTNQDRQSVAPMRSSLKNSVTSTGIGNTSPKKTTFMPTTTTWQRQALSNQTTPSNSARQQDSSPIDDSQLTNEYRVLKMQLEIKKRSIEREKKLSEKMCHDKRRTISEDAFKKFLEQNTRNTSALTNEFFPPAQSNNNNSIRKSQTTSEFRPRAVASPVSQPTFFESNREESSVVNFPQPMTRDDELHTTELSKQRYRETHPTTTTSDIPDVIDEHRIEQLNSNIGELQQVLTDLSAKQEEIHTKALNASGSNVSRNATFSTKSTTVTRRKSSLSIPDEQEEECSKTETVGKGSGLLIVYVDNPSASTETKIERNREVVIKKQEERQRALEEQRKMREAENLRRKDERRRIENEESRKKNERVQKRDNIFQDYIMNKDTNGEHPTIKMRPKSSNPITNTQKPDPAIISTFGAPTDVFNTSDLNETITTPSLSFTGMAELRARKLTSQSPKVGSGTLPRPPKRPPTEPHIPVSEPRYPLAKPLSGKSNKQTIINALTQVVLAGKTNDSSREQVCDEVEHQAQKIKHFIILFRDSSLKFRSVYTFVPPAPASDTPASIERIYGQGPREITEAMVETYYKYNSGSKQFSRVPTKSFSFQCDAITISSHYWTQPSTTSKRTTILPPSPSE